MTATVRVGVGVVLRLPDGRVAVGERLGSHGANRLAFPGGHLEMFESWESCARREVAEETGLELTGPLRHVATTNDPMHRDGKHYITIFMQADVAEHQQELRNLEPHKCAGWTWRSWAELREEPEDRLFMPLVHLLQMYDPRREPFSDRARESPAEIASQRLFGSTLLVVGVAILLLMNGTFDEHFQSSPLTPLPVTYLRIFGLQFPF